MIDTLRNGRGERLDFSFHPGADERRDVLVIGHGVTGNKDRPFAQALAGAASAAGIPALRLSFAGNGESEGEFTASHPTKEVEDLLSVLDALGDRRVTYAGHSMGAAAGVLAAARDERIRFLVSLAGMVHTAEFARRKFGDLTPGRDCMWEKPECPLSQEFLDDMNAIDTVAPLGAEVRVPWLLVHGTADDVVPLQDSRDILKHAGENAELVVLEGADHVFSGDAAARMAEAVVHWLSARLG